MRRAATVLTTGLIAAGIGVAGVGTASATPAPGPDHRNNQRIDPRDHRFDPRDHRWDHRRDHRDHRTVVVVCRDRRGHIIRFIDPSRREINRIVERRLQCQVFIVRDHGPRIPVHVA